MDMAASLVMWHKPFVLTVIIPSHGGSTWNLASVGLAAFKEKKFENVESEWPSYMWSLPIWRKPPNMAPPFSPPRRGSKNPDI